MFARHLPLGNYHALGLIPEVCHGKGSMANAIAADDLCGSFTPQSQDNEGVITCKNIIYPGKYWPRPMTGSIAYPRGQLHIFVCLPAS
jgi:hypothetical protein